MKGNQILDALEHIDPMLIQEAEAAVPQKRRKPFWMSAAAALLALVIGIGVFLHPLTTNVHAVSKARYPRYRSHHNKEYTAISESLGQFFQQSMLQTLSDSGDENKAYSPINLYLALCISAELSGGDTQILELLGAASLEELRSQASQVWNATYLDDGNQALLANSLWLDETLGYNQKVMDTLAKNYYTSVYQGDLGSQDVNKAIGKWLDAQTDGLLKQESGKVSLDQDIVMALYSTVFYQAQWGLGYETQPFSKGNNTVDVFHAPGGDLQCTYMHKEKIHTYYYVGEDFGAVYLHLRDGSRMWFFLPDEGKTVDDVLQRGEYAHFLFSQVYPEDMQDQYKYMKVNLSLPKFDIRSSSDLKDDLQNMGITNIFDPVRSSLSHSLTGDMDVWLAALNQSTRVAIDEEGVTAASYMEMPGAGAAMPPDEIIDFVLDRPFLFVITNQYNMPLFAGVVNAP